MARLKQTHTLLFSVDTTGEEVLFELAPAQAEYTDVMNACTVRRTLMIHGTDFTISVPAGANYIYLESTKTVSIQLDTTVEGGPVFGIPIPVAPMSATFPGRFNIFTSGITSVTVANPGAAAADDASVTLVIGSVEAPVVV